MFVLGQDAGSPCLTYLRQRRLCRKAILSKDRAGYSGFALKSTRLQLKSILPRVFFAHLWIFEVLTYSTELN